MKANVEDDAQLLGEAGALILGGVVGADIAHTLGGFANTFSQAPHLAHPCLAQLINLTLKLGDDPDLERVENDRGKAEDGVLGEHEDQDGEQRAALEGRECESLGDEAAERFDLGCDHLHQFALGDPFEMRQRKAHDARKKFIAQAAQHALADDALINVDHIFKGAVDQHQDKEQTAQGEEVTDLIQLDAEKTAAVTAGHGIVDDGLGQIEADIEERK